MNFIRINKKVFFQLVSIFILLIPVNDIIAQETGFKNIEPFDVNASSDPEVAILWKPITFDFTLRNVNVENGLGINSISFVDFPKNTLLEPDNELLNEPITLNKVGDTYRLNNITVKSISFLGNIGEYIKSIFFVSNEITLHVEIQYKDLGDGFGRLHTKTIPIKIYFRPHPFSIWVGSIFGVILIALFLKQRDNNENKKSFYKRIITGSITVTIAIPLVLFTTEISLPISVKIEDFWGGFILGLFSEWIGNKITLLIRQT